MVWAECQKREEEMWEHDDIEHSLSLSPFPPSILHIRVTLYASVATAERRAQNGCHNTTAVPWVRQRTNLKDFVKIERISSKRGSVRSSNYSYCYYSNSFVLMTLQLRHRCHSGHVIVTGGFTHLPVQLGHCQSWRSALWGPLKRLLGKWAD